MNDNLYYDTNKLRIKSVTLARKNRFWVVKINYWVMNEKLFYNSVEYEKRNQSNYV